MKFDTQRRFDCAAAGLAVLRGLKLTDRRMTYGEFATAIGLRAPGEKWVSYHRRQVGDTLHLIAAVAKKAGEGGKIDFSRVYVAATGKPGKGLHKEARLVIHGAQVAA
jgi:hypothetical protein